jgi:hypothetical protein
MVERTSQNNLTSDLPDDPNQQLGLEILPNGSDWGYKVGFTPEFYPNDFTQMKKKELNRYGGSNCEAESVSIKSVKNREFHIAGLMIESQIQVFQDLLDSNSEVDILSPLTPNGGMECFLKKGELGNYKGYDPHTEERIFEYTLDLVSTGRDETENERNAIVTSIVDIN